MDGPADPLSSAVAATSADRPVAIDRPLRIAVLSPPMLAIPPATYAGTERVVAALVEELHARGHDVTLFAPGDSTVDCRLVPTIPRSLWSTGYQGPVDAFIDLTLARAWADHERFDIIHSHLETGGFLFARHCPTPVVSTLHGRLDHAGMPELLEEFTDIPLVAISESQRRWSPRANWVATVHHGLPLEWLPFNERQGTYLAFVGRVTPEKGIADAIELARRTRLPLRMAAKVYDPHEVSHFQEVVQPAIDEGVVEFLGELGQTERDALYAGAVATVMLGAWPEPFGLVAIESMATGTPIIGRRAGALTETVEHGITGYLVDDLIEAELAVRKVARLSRQAVRQRVIERFLPSRMADEYVQVYRRLLGLDARTAAPSQDRSTASDSSRGGPASTDRSTHGRRYGSAPGSRHTPKGGVRLSAPLSPPPVTRTGQGDLPAYVSNGLIGLRVLDIPLLPGVVLVNGYTGLHPVVEVDSAAQAPYPIAGDIGLDGAWLTTSPHQAKFVDQRYDFGTGELHTRFTFHAARAAAHVDVVTFCSRKRPTLVLQEVTVEVDAASELVLRAVVDESKVRGQMARRSVATEEADDEQADGSLSWESLGGRSLCGIAHVTELLGDADARRAIHDWGIDGPLATDYTIKAKPGRRYRLRQIASMVPSRLHHEPAQEATRRVCQAGADGFDTLREENRVEWEETWKARVVITADDERWQRLADAAFFYLNSSVHPSAPSSTSIYGLAQWNDYHYYYGHVMWDVETFTIPPLLLSQPDAARTLLEYRSQCLAAARKTAKLHGRRGLQFPWESGPLEGEESAPGAGKASWHEDHVSLDVAVAFAQYAHATGDLRFLEHEAEPVLHGVADWITSRVTRRRGGFDLRRTMGIAERPEPSDNDAFTVMSAIRVLQEAIACAQRLGREVPAAWEEVLAGLALPQHSRSGAILSHDGFHPNEEKGATPGPLAGLFPLWHPAAPEVAAATLDYYLRIAPGYIGSAMLSPLYGVWAAWTGDRARSARLFEEGYARLVADRFLQTLEQAPDLEPEKPDSGPFFANMGGFLIGLMYGLPGIRIGPGEPQEWAVRRVVLPAGWRSIEIERAWIRRRPASIVAEHGAERAIIGSRVARRRRLRVA